MNVGNAFSGRGSAYGGRTRVPALRKLVLLLVIEDDRHDSRCRDDNAEIRLPDERDTLDISR